MLSSAAAVQSAWPDPFLFKIRDLVYQVAGIFQPDNRLRFLEERCARRMKDVGARNTRDYFDRLVISVDREAELRNLLNEITVGETCFFRNQPQLDALQNVVLPALIQAKQRLPLRHLKIWSAGCSTGEEPYTLAAILNQLAQTKLAGFTFEILATDINDLSLRRAEAGNYGEYALRNVPPGFMQRYFETLGDQQQVGASLKAHVKFTRLNLLDDARMVFLKGMDIIFCCNVLIYFDGASKRRVIQHFFNNLLPGGYLFLGHSESLFGVNADFRLVHFSGATAYMRPAPQMGGAR